MSYAREVPVGSGGVQRSELIFAGYVVYNGLPVRVSITVPPWSYGLGLGFDGRV